MLQAEQDYHAPITKPAGRADASDALGTAREGSVSHMLEGIRARPGQMWQGET